MRYGLTVVGHIVLDYISRGGVVHGPIPGGPCVFAGLAARALGASVAVVSKVGHDFGQKRLSWLRARGISIRRIRIANSPTTCFRINYRNHRRVMRVDSTCDPIKGIDISKLPFSAAIHIGPVYHEIAPSLAKRLGERDSVLCLDPQGYLRQLTADGTVRIRRWWNSGLLKRIDVLKASEEELEAIVGKKASRGNLAKLGPEIILSTRGIKGTTLWSTNKGMFHVPAYKISVRDPTGAGDALVGAFLAEWIRNRDLLWSAAIGSAVASFVVEKFGPANFGTRRQIESRAAKILEGTMRVSGR